MNRDERRRFHTPKYIRVRMSSEIRKVNKIGANGMVNDKRMNKQYRLPSARTDTVRRKFRRKKCHSVGWAIRLHSVTEWRYALFDGCVTWLFIIIIIMVGTVGAPEFLVSAQHLRTPLPLTESQRIPPSWLSSQHHF